MSERDDYPQRPALSPVGQAALDAARQEPEPETADDDAGDTAGKDSQGKTEQEKPPQPSQATQLVKLAELRYEMCCSTDGEPFALLHTGPRIARMLRGGRSSLRAELAAAYAKRNRGTVPSASALADALTVIEGQATADDVEPVPLHLRVAEHQGAVYLDLGRGDGACIRVDPSGWERISYPPVVFRRTALTMPLPEPARHGDLDALWQLLNVAPRYRPVLAAVLVAALLPGIPHPILLLTGEYGTAKTTATKLISMVLDPSAVQVRKAPKDADSWVTAAAGSWVVGLDNLSTVPDWLSDALCRASTGEGDVRRRLYTDGDLHVVAFRRQVIANGIDLAGLRGDLADRLVTVALTLIPDTDRWPESELPDRWAAVHPAVLGALLDLTTRVLAELPTVRLPSYPRMADFAKVLAAVDRVLDTKGLATYVGSRAELAEDAVSSDPVLSALTARVSTEFVGTSARLLEVITPDDKPKDWPTARKLTTALRRDAPTLRRLGWTVDELPKDAYTRAIQFRLVPPAREDDPPDRDGETTTLDTLDSLDTAASSQVSTATESRATARQESSESSNDARRSTVTRPDARQPTPPLTSTNGHQSSDSSDTSDESPPSLSATPHCRVCGQRLLLPKPGRDTCEQCRLAVDDAQP